MLWTCRVLCSQAGPSAGGWKPLRFDGGAFHLKSTGELTRALLLQAWSQRLLGSQLSGAFLRASVYGQFVAGETTEEVRGCVQQLQSLGLRPLLAVPTEEEPDSAVKTGEAWYEGNLSAMLRCVDLSRGLLESPGPTGNILMQLKITALMSTRLCKELTSRVRRPGGSLELSPERLAEAMDSGQDLQVSCLNVEQTRHLQASLSRLHRVVQHARAQHVRLLVDAEYTSLNPALSLLVAALATRWNGPREGGPWVWNTYQAYLKDTYEQLRRDAEAADRAGLAFGVKLVRGAYLDKEREVARLQGTEDPTQPDYKATSQSYSRCLELMLTQVSHRGPMCPLMVASHNEDSVHQATKRMWELGIPLDGPVCFGQLLGMCDHVSLALDGAWGSLSPKHQPTPCNYSPSRAGWLCCVQVHPLWLPGGSDPLPDPEGPGEPKRTAGCPQGTGTAQSRTSAEAAGAGPEGTPLAPPGLIRSIKVLSCCPGSCPVRKPPPWGRAHLDLSQPKLRGLCGSREIFR
ncbi:hydroxyproline dehydrogenase isoform X2 [Delphinus delphis]|uniref:hydroxyproline dehydrogenase isoform X2 n=1 Tax=Delphinus delphis TaxID=9728 RepID=UPI0028C4C426|nr:hydroxyproline dehydrogenase isoform X2 [Delphinus delphis]